MVLERKATGNEEFHTYKDGFGTLAEPSKMVSRVAPASSFASGGTSTVQYRPTTPVGPESCLIHSFNILNTSSTTDCFLELYDHRGTSATTARRTRLVMTSDPYIALAASSRGATDTVAVDDSSDFAVGNIVSIVPDGDDGLATDKNNMGYEECVITAIPSSTSVTLRRGTGGTTPVAHYDNAVMHGGRLRMKMMIQGRDKAKPDRNIVLPIPMLMENGWAFRSYSGTYSATSAIIVNTTYTKLEHNAQTNQTDLESPYINYIGQVPDAHHKFLRASWRGSNNGDDGSGVVAHWPDNDVEIYGISFVSNTVDGYKTVYGRNGGGTNMLYHTVMGTDVGDDDDDPKGPFGPMWFPYPIYCKGGLSVYHSAIAGYSTIFYRPVKDYNSTASDSMLDV